MSARPRWRRRQFIIPGFHLRYLGEHLVFVLALGLALVVTVFGPLVFELSRNANPGAATHFLWLHRWFWPVVGGVVIMMALHAVSISHRIAGPLYRFRRIFEAMRDGDLTPRVRVRARDYLTEEAASFDAALQEVNRRVRELQERVGDTAAVATSLDGLTASSRAQLEESVGALARAASALRTSAASPQPCPEPNRREVDSRISAVDAGVSLIELLIVVALVTTLGSIGVPTYLAALERARVTRAIGDIRNIETEIRVFFVIEKRLPATLADVRQVAAVDPWGNEYVYTNLLDTKGKGKARKDRFLNPLNSEFDLYSKGKDGQSSTPLTAKASRDDVVRANDGGFIGLASEY